MAEPDDLWDDIREKLTAYDLLKYDKEKKTFTTHRAIQRVIQSRVKGEEKDSCIALASVLNRLFPVYDYVNREACEKYYQHVLVLLKNWINWMPKQRTPMGFIFGPAAINAFWATMRQRRNFTFAR